MYHKINFLLFHFVSALAFVFHKAGAKVILAARRRDALEEVKDELVSMVYIFICTHFFLVISNIIVVILQTC